RLDQTLWPKAGEEQKQRLIQDPFYDQLQPDLEHVTYETIDDISKKRVTKEVFKAKIASKTVWEILDMRGGHRTQDHNQRMGKAMRDLGYSRANAADLVSIDGKLVVGYVKGNAEDEGPWYVIEAIRSLNELRAIVRREGDPKP